MEDETLIRQLEQVNALNSVALAQALQAEDPSWGTQTQPVAGGHLVLCGAGLYVNRVIATGITEVLRVTDLALIRERSAAIGVDAEVEATPITLPESRAALAAGGFCPEPGGGTSVHVHPVDRLPSPPSRPDIRMMRVSDSSLEEWQEVSATGWGHATPAARRAADAFSRAAHAVDGDGMILALDADDGRPLACASLTIHDEVATLGGMSTLPTERGRGVQTALIAHRLRVARDAGCTLAMVTTSAGGASERNVRRLGFRTTHVKHTHSG